MAPVKSCVCSIPRPRSNPGHENTCVVCGFRIPPEWGSDNIGPIFDRLAQGFVTGPTDAFKSMRDLCLSREQDGRRHFGFRFMGRNNLRDAREEAADLANYLAFHILVARRDGDQELEDRTMNAMMAVFDAFEALHALALE